MSDGFLKTEGVNVGSTGSTPSGPKTGDLTVINNVLKYYNGSAFVSASGSGSGQGLNFVTNPVADSTDGFTLYDDGSAVPVDGTGGTVNFLTFTRNTSSPIHGDADFKLAKSANNAQGEGLAYAFTTGTAFTPGLKVTVDLFCKGSANFVFGESSDLRIYAYDVTNGALITPSRTSILSPGEAVSSFQLTSGVSYRLLLHVATTNASAWDFQFKFLFVGPGRPLTGPNITDWQSYPLTIGATVTAPTKGTIVTDEAKWRQVGDSIEIEYEYEQSAAGASGSGNYLFPIPSGYEIDTTKKIVSTNGYSGMAGGVVAYSGAAIGEGYAVAYNSTNLMLVASVGATATLSAISAGHFDLGGAANITYSIKVSVPIKNMSANTAVGQAGVLRLSDLVAQGTRVTGAAPDALGEYRSYLRNASAFTFTETNGDPTIAPSQANGIRLYGGNAFNVADNNNEPSRYDFFVGFNKVVRYEPYSTTGRTGYVSTDAFQYSGGRDVGVTWHYDPSTGVLVVEAWRYLGGTTAHSCGLDSASVEVDDIYFDFYIADNDFQIQLQSQNDTPVILKDVKSANTDGGTFTSGAWQTRTLNTVENSQGWISLSSNQFTLQSGTYEIEVSSPGYAVDEHQTRLRNITDSTNASIGSSEFSGATNPSQTRSKILTVLTVGSAKTFEIQHQCTTTGTTTGFGTASNFGVDEVYTIVRIKKIR